MDLKTGNPFQRVHFHNVKVPQDVVRAGAKPFKSYICLSESKNPTINHEKYGVKCPFCEVNQIAYKKSTECTDPLEKKHWQELSLENKSNEAIIVRCIERGHEEDGVKFWKFNLRQDKKDPYHLMMELYKKRKSEAEAEGRTENIFDIYDGYDLTITFNVGSPVPPPSIMDAKRSSPLSNDEELMRKWIYDEKTWQDVFTPKPYDYLKLISEGKTPWYDKESGGWVDKEEYQKEHGEYVKAADNEIEEAERKLRNEEPVINVNKKALADAVTVTDSSDDDLPF